MSKKLDEHYAEAKAAAKLYAEAEVDLLKLKVAKVTTRYIGKVVTFVIILLIGASSFVILLIALGFVLGVYLQNTGLGFLCAGIIGLLLVAISALFLRKVVERFVLQDVLSELFDA